MKALPIGTDNFKDIVESCYYIDKTEIIHKLLFLAKGSPVLFTRPRRFGKSLMLSMIKSFFEKGHDEIYPYFQHLKIAKYPEDVDNNMGKYDVIEINMKDATASSKDGLVEKLRQIIVGEFKRHQGIIECLGQDDRELFRHYLENEMSEAEFRSSIKELSRLIFIATKSRPIFLMDEYDMPLQSAYEHHYYDEIYELLKGLYSESIKSNEYLRLTILSGVTRAGKMSLFSGLNNLIVDTVLDTKYQNDFGFTEEECKELLMYYGCENQFETVRKWYGGFRFGSSEIFNPWSILNFIANDCKAKDYWNSTTTTSLIKTLITNNYLNINEPLLKLMKGESVDALIDVTINYADINTNSQSILSFLLFMGYLSVDQSYEEGYSVKIPNEEIRRVFSSELSCLLIGSNNFTLQRNIYCSLENDDAESFTKYLEDYLLASLSYYDFNSEKNYQIMLLTLFAIIFSDCMVRSEANVSEGRCDIIVMPKNSKSKAYVVEIKHVVYKTSKTRLKERADKAIQQIIDKGYYKDLFAQGVKNVTAYGIAFSKQSAVAATKKILSKQ